MQINSAEESAVFGTNNQRKGIYMNGQNGDSLPDDERLALVTDRQELTRAKCILCDAVDVLETILEL
jgi:hypothetical protein